MGNVNVLALTLGKETPSSRFRVRKLIADLSLYGVDVNERYSKYCGYPPYGLINRVNWLPKTALDTYQRVNESDKYDVSWIQKPLISTLYSFERFVRTPMVFDIDDATHLGTRGGNCKRIAEKSNHVICGNSFLADYYSQFSQVSIIPTAVNTSYFTPANNNSKEQLIVGWSGSSSGFSFLYEIEEQLLKLIKKHPKLIIKIISNEMPEFKLLPADNIKYVKWSSENEVREMQDFTVGLMPLTDSLWSRGKCSYKMLTYMSAAIPVVVSAVGMNVEVMEHGECGILIDKKTDWAEAIESILSSENLQRKMALTGRNIVCEHYSNEIIVPKVADVLKGVL